MYNQFPQLNEVFGLDPTDDYVATTDELTGNPLRYLNHEIHVVGKLKQIVESMVYLETPAKDWLNKGEALPVALNEFDRKKLKRLGMIADSNIGVYVRGRLGVLRSESFRNPGNICLKEAVLENVLDLEITELLPRQLDKFNHNQSGERKKGQD